MQANIHDSRNTRSPEIGQDSTLDECIQLEPAGQIELERSDSGEGSVIQDDDAGPEPLDDANPQKLHVANPLVLDPSAYYSPASRAQSCQYVCELFQEQLLTVIDWLGISSNWSFGIRVLRLSHEKLFGDAPLPHSVLHYEGSTYDIGWDGRRAFDSQPRQPVLPTADFALLLINTVKFHCSKLYYLFDETSFMSKFKEAYANSATAVAHDELWYIHYMLVLAIGKALKSRVSGRRPPGADLFGYAMRMLPDMVYLTSRPLVSAEVLCCAALYLQCVDMRISAYNYIGQAIRLAMTNGWHLDIPQTHFAEHTLERCQRVWWTIYVLDCRMSALQGLPATIDPDDIRARLPAFDGDKQSLCTLEMHVKLCKIVATIQQTVYTRHNASNDHFVKSIKAALTALADLNDTRSTHFPLDLEDSSLGISRAAADLHLFHHQAIIFCIKPLLFIFFKKRLETSKSTRIPSSGGARALAYTSIGSARQIMNILTALHTNDLLDVFLPFDLEALWSGVLVLLIVRFVDPSICSTQDSSLSMARAVLEDMSLKGNLLAACRKSEMEYLDMTLQQLAATQLEVPDLGFTPCATEDSLLTNDPQTITNTLAPVDVVASESSTAESWNIDELLDSQQLEAVANSLDINGLNWFEDLMQYGDDMQF